MLQEHFAIGAKDWKGVHGMTIHKSKGKEFDQVIVYGNRPVVTQPDGYTETATMFPESLGCGPQKNHTIAILQSDRGCRLAVIDC